MKRSPAGATALTQKLRLTRWTAHYPVTKRLAFGDDGRIEKKSTAAQLYEGTVDVLELTPKGFVQALNTIGPLECLSYGVPIDDTVTRVMSKARFAAAGNPSGTMTRTALSMDWPAGPGLLEIDYDPGARLYSKDELLQTIYRICPALKVTAHVWGASTSSCLINIKTKKEVRGIEGQRVYLVVADGTDIVRAANVLFKRLWLDGHGEIKVSKSGNLLTRGPLDLAVFQPNRIDYCAPAICEPPLKQRKPKPQLLGDPTLALDTRTALPDLTEAETQRFDEMVAAAKKEKAQAAAEARAAYRESRVTELVAKGCDPTDAAKTIDDALAHDVLGPEFCLVAKDGTHVTVTEILADPSRWHEMEFADPLEPDYHDDPRIARAFLLGPGRPHIYSFAHGGRRFELSRAPMTVRLVSGLRADYVEHIVAELRSRHAFYSRGGIVALDSEGVITPQNEEHVVARLDRAFRFERIRKDKFIVVDTPQALAKHILKAHGNSFAPLRAVVDGPAMDPTTGRLLLTSGYDEKTRIYVAAPSSSVSISAAPTLEEVQEALRVLWFPVHLFPFAAPVDESVMFGGLLSAVIRPFLPTCPAFAFDAPIQASGKTLLVKCMSVLRGGRESISPQPDARSDEEMRKRIFAMALEGKDTIVIDNIVGELNSPALASYLTSEEYSDRELGKSSTPTVPVTALVLLSGNNLILNGDLPRRVLRCRIDPQQENPHQRQFDFNPVSVMREHRQALRRAAHTILRAAWAEHQSSGKRRGAGRLASFETWDDVVRQAICWLAEHQQAGRLPCGKQANGDHFPQLVDPMRAIDEAVAKDPTRTQQARLLNAWADEIGTGPTRATTRTVAELTSHGAQFSSAAIGAGAASKELLRDVLVEMAGSPGTHQINPRSLGKRLSNYKDRIVDGKCLRQGASQQNVSTWWVEDLSSPGGFGGFGGSALPSPVNKQKSTSLKTKENKPTKPMKPTKCPRISAAAAAAVVKNKATRG